MNYERSIVLVPTYKYIEHETDAALRQLEKMGIRVERSFGMSAIDQHRAIQATWAITRPQGYEYIYWIDSDTHFDTLDFQCLTEGPMWSCIPYQAKMPHGGIAVMGDVDSTTRGVVPLRAAGFGFMKTHRSLFEAMAKELPTCQQTPGGKPLIPFFQPRVWDIDGRKVYYGEDYSFCLHGEQLGFKLYGNFDRNIGHIGRYSYRIQEPF